MGWRTVVVNKHSKLSYKNNHFIYNDSITTQTIHLSEIDVLLLETTDIVLSTMLLKRLVDENVLVIFCDDKRLPKSFLMPYSSKHDSSLQLSRQVQWEHQIKANVWTIIIAQKIYNQYMVLKNYNYVQKAQSIYDLYEQLEILDPANREGHSARIYFNTLFGNDFSREQDNTVNAGLDYGYTLLMSLFAREIVASGCMTQFGLKHANQFNAYNLASDFMEPFRVIVDDIVYTNRNQPFEKIKCELFQMFTQTYRYKNKDMYLTNIISDYTKKVIKSLNNNGQDLPVFEV